jgi:DNA-binding IclR family transcriptional regulator
MRTRQLTSAPVGVLTKVLAIFELLDRNPDGLQLRHIAELTKFNKSTSYRLLTHLEGTGYLVRDHQGAYFLGPRLVKLGSNSTYQSTIRRISRPTLEDLRRITEETVNLAVLDGPSVLYIDVLESPHLFRMVSEIGMRRALHCTGLGKAILAWQPPDVRERLLRSMQLDRFTEHTIVRKSDLISELGRVERRGYAVDNEEAQLGARCLAAPIFDSEGAVTAGISVSGPLTRMTRNRTAEIAKAIKTAAAEISLHLGHVKN